MTQNNNPNVVDGEVFENLNVIARDENGRFPKGVSGNPLGRPAGSRNQTTLLREKLDEVAVGEVAKEYVNVVHAMLREAKKGNVAAARLIKEIADIVNEDDRGKSGGKTIQVYIENATLEVQKDK